jgi:dihydrodipicolinate synthase/N-acetylneuraminate lyase
MYNLIYSPRRGLSIPSVTALDDVGAVIEEDQRRVFRFNVQNGFAADIIFGVGTNGEWNRISNAQRQRVIAVEIDELKKINQHLIQRGFNRTEAWVGVTGATRRETLSNLELAIDKGADAAVIAPLSIAGVDDVVDFFLRDVTDLMDRKGQLIPVFLYDNADIAIHPSVPHIRTRDVKKLSRLSYIFGIKVSASRRVLGNYTKASLHFKDKGAFGIYIGNAMLIFDLFKPKEGFLGTVTDYWDRYLLQNELPIGVVSGPANVFPREWQKAWQACYTGDTTLMEIYRWAFESFGAACAFEENGQLTTKMIACLKYALYLDGVISSYHVAPGTPALTADQEKVFADRYGMIKDYLSQNTDPLWRSTMDGRPARSPRLMEGGNV